MKKYLVAAAMVTALASQNASAANDWPYWYLGLSGGVAGQRDSDWKRSDGARGEFDNEPGYVVTASLGYRPHNTGGFLDSSRFELEGSYRKQSFDTPNSGGEFRVVTTALNYYYDFAPDAGVNPYIGAGIGYGQFSYGGNNDATADGDDTRFIYQLMAGLGFSFEELPHTEWTLGYRYFAPFGKVDTRAALGETVKVEYDNHSIEAGARFRF